MGDYPAVDGIWDVDALGLVRLLAGLNAGHDHHGRDLAAGTAFEIGARVNLGRHDLEESLERAHARWRQERSS